VHKSWATYFKGLDNGLPSEQAFRPPPTAVGSAGVPYAADGAPSLHLGEGGSELTDHLKVSLFSASVSLPCELRTSQMSSLWSSLLLFLYVGLS
jgi:hypothetical protein